MGTFHTKIEVSRERGGAFKDVRALVDTGAILSMLPTSFLRDLGVEADTDEVFILADGRRQRLPIGDVWVRIGPEVRFTPVIFGPEDRFLLGAVTLQEFRLIADTTHHKLIRAPELTL